MPAVVRLAGRGASTAEFGGSCPPGYSPKTRDDIRTNTVAGDVFLSVGGAMALTGLLLYTLAPSWEDEQEPTTEEGVELGAALGPSGDGSGVGLLVRGRF
jgi:hypothetical protein